MNETHGTPVDPSDISLPPTEPIDITPLVADLLETA